MIFMGIFSGGLPVHPGSQRWHWKIAHVRPIDDFASYKPPEISLLGSRFIGHPNEIRSAKFTLNSKRFSRLKSTFPL